MTKTASNIPGNGFFRADESGIPATGFMCAICFNWAQVFMDNTTFCVDHAKRYNFGYGESLQKMRKEYDKMSKLS